MKSKKVAFLGLLIALAMILSYIETLIPPFVPVPGIKLGLPNIAIIIVLYKVGWKEAICVSLIRVLLVSFMFGSVMSLLYSLAGAILSFIVMLILMRINFFSKVVVSVAGGVFHNIGQVIVACLVTSTVQIVYYLPVLLISGTISGVIIGLIGIQVVKKLDKIQL